MKQNSYLVYIFMFVETTLSSNEKMEHISELKEVVRRGQIPAGVSHLVCEIGPSFLSA